MLVGSKVVKPLENKIFNKLNNPRSALGQKLKKTGSTQLRNQIQDKNKPHRSPLEK